MRPKRPYGFGDPDPAAMPAAGLLLRYSSISAFAPICNPTKVPWGQKAFKFYLGSDEQAAHENGELRDGDT